MAPKTNAERQRDYRARQKGAHRLNTWLAPDAHNALARLTAHHGTTQRVVLEALILASDQQLGALPHDNEVQP